MRVRVVQLTDKELDAAMAEMDEDGSGALDIDEFWTWWKHHLGDRMALCDRPLVRSPDVSLLSWHAEHLSLCVC